MPDCGACRMLTSLVDHSRQIKMLVHVDHGANREAFAHKTAAFSLLQTGNFRTFYGCLYFPYKIGRGHGPDKLAIQHAVQSFRIADDVNSDNA